MSLRYSLTLTKEGTYLFTTDQGIAYIAFFTHFLIKDSEDNTHKAYSFGFDRSGKYSTDKFVHKFDDKIKQTIIFIIQEFFRLNSSEVLVYFCYQEDAYARHRSITFSKWYLDDFSEAIEHHKKNIIFQAEMLYVGVLVLKENPLRQLLLEALDTYLLQITQDK